MILKSKKMNPRACKAQPQDDRTRLQKYSPLYRLNVNHIRAWSSMVFTQAMAQKAAMTMAVGKLMP